MDQLRGGRWPDHLQTLLGQLFGEPQSPTSKDQALGETWLLLTAVLRHYLRLHASRRGFVDEEDLRDIASEKALELLRQFESGKGNPAHEGSSGLRGYLSTVARNGLVDLLRRKAHQMELTAVESGVEEGGPDSTPAWPAIAEDPLVSASRTEFAEALRHCLFALPERNRTVWFFRVFHEMSSKMIASHPDIRLRPAHVDVLLQRVRDAIRGCMGKKGFTPEDMPPGTLVEIWQAFRPIPSRPEMERS